MFIAAVFTIAKTGKQVNAHWYRNGQEDLVHICNELLLSHKRKWNNAICINMDAGSDCHTEWSKSNRERQIDDIAYMCNLKNGTNELKYKIKIELQI